MGDLYPVLLHAAVNDGPTLRALVGMHLPTYAAVTHVKVSSTVLDSVLDLAAVCGALRVPIAVWAAITVPAASFFCFCSPLGVGVLFVLPVALLCLWVISAHVSATSSGLHLAQSRVHRELRAASFS